MHYKNKIFAEMLYSACNHDLKLREIIDKHVPLNFVRNTPQKTFI